MKNLYYIDAHAHIGYMPTLIDSEKYLIKSDKKNNINFCLFSFDGTEFADEKDKRSRVVSQIIAFNKAYEFQSQYPNRFGMLCWIRPHTESNYKEVESFIQNHRSSIYGLKFHPWCSQMRINDPALIPYLKIAEKFNLPICVHTAVDKFSQIKYLEQVCKDWPHLNFIAAHAELYSDHKSTIKAIQNCSNLYADTAWVDIECINEFKEKGLMDRIMFGTDNPIDGEGTLDKEIYKKYFKNSINLNEEDYAKLMYKNAVNVYKIDEKVLKAK